MSADRKRIRIGIDIGGTNIKIGLVDEKQTLFAVKSIPTEREKPWQTVIKNLAEAVTGILEEQNIPLEQCEGAGIGVPGLVDEESGAVIYANNLEWTNIPLKEELSKYWSFPIKAANDADCAVLGETAAGAARGCRNVIMLTLGTGVGGGIVLNGRLFSGSMKGGCELGHMVIQEGGEPCTCGRRGCMEAYASATALIRDGKRAMDANPDTVLWQKCNGDREKLTPPELFQAAREGDETARKTVDAYRYMLAVGIANFINIFRPQMILIGGGISKQGEFLFAPIRDMLKEQCYGGDMGDIPPVREAMLGNDAGMIGAANLL